MNQQSIGVVGCGQMGSGIIEVAARAGFSVVAVKLTGNAKDAAARVLASLDRLVKKAKLTTAERDEVMARITFTNELKDLAECSLVVESAVEDVNQKRRLFAEIEACLAPGAVLATNTSSLRLSAFDDVLARPAQFLGLHFFNPVQLMALVEVGPTAKTTPEAVETARAFVAKIGKTAVQVADSPGYVVNRLLVPYILHAIETLEAGIASADEIDAAMKLGCGHPMGPLAVADLIGLDVVFAMAKTLHAELNDTRYRAPSLLRRLLLAGHVGRKAGKGIYDYTGETPVVNVSIGQASLPPTTARVASR